jgi:alpha-beta hydrolase superfamily lysophospholipase
VSARPAIAADVPPKIFFPPRTPAIVRAIVDAAAAAAKAAAAADAATAATAADADAAIAAAAAAGSKIIKCKNCGCVFFVTSFHGFHLLHACCYSDIALPSPELLSSSNFLSKSASRNSIGTTL